MYSMVFAGAVRPSNLIPELNPYDSGKPQELKSKMTLGDNFDLHHVPDKFASMRGLKGYDPQTGTAIVLPKAEHRQIPPP